MVKLVGALCVSLSVAAFGLVKSERFCVRVKYLKAMLRFSKEAVQHMSSYKRDIFSIFHGFSEKELVFLKRITPDSITDTARLQQLLRSDGIFECDIELFTDFLLRLGNGDIEQQRLLCGQFSEAVSLCLKNAENDLYEKGRLQRSLCLFLAAAIFIILI